MEALGDFWSDFFGALHSIQPTRATTRPAFRENLRWWANKTSPRGIPNQNAAKSGQAHSVMLAHRKGGPKRDERRPHRSRFALLDLGSVDLLHIIPARAVATLQPHIGDDARFCRAGINTVRSDHDGQIVLALTVSR
jgi:hypothetical protein